MVDWCNSHQAISFAVLSCIWVFLLYYKALHAPFVYDDLEQISNNPNLGSLHSLFTRFFLSPVTFSNQYRDGFSGSTYRPIFWLSLFLDNKLWGITGASGFHLTNLLLHWINGLLLFTLLRTLRVGALTAAGTTLLWLGLPINSEAVIWVSARAYLLCALFLFLSLRAASSYLRTGNLSALAAYFAGSIATVFSHEEGLLLLPLTTLLVYATDQKTSRRWTKLLGLASLSALLYLLVKSAVGAQPGKGPSALWSVGLTFWHYMQWIIAPIHFSVERSTSTPDNIPSFASLAAWVAFLCTSILAYHLRKREPLISVGLALCFILLLPFSGIVFLYQGMAERFAYLASTAVALLVIALAQARVKRWRNIAMGCVVAWAVWGAWRIQTRVLEWCDPVQLYQSSLEATPNSPILYYDLGALLKEKGDLPAAIEAYRQAARLRPNYPQAFSSLGEIYFRLNRPLEAVDAYHRSLAINPQDTAVMLNLAVALEQLGNKKEAEEQLKRVTVLAPTNQSACLDLGVLLFQMDRIDEAIKYIQKAIDLKPSDPTAYYDLAALFQKSGRNDLAVPFYRKVLELKPGDPDTISNLSKMSRR